MKIIYNNNILKLDSTNNISSYHLLLLCLGELNESVENIDKYYLTNLEGHPLNHTSIINKNRTYYLKRKNLGANDLYRKENSKSTATFGGLFFAVVAVIYYNFYYNKLINSNLPEKFEGIIKSYAYSSYDSLLNTKIPEFNVAKYSKVAEQSGMMGGENMSTWQKIKNFLICCLNKLSDDNLSICSCFFVGVIPTLTTSKMDNSFAASISSALFYTFIFMILLPMFINSITTRECGNPGNGIVFIALLFLLIPLALTYITPIVATKLPSLNRFKLAFSNLLLFVFMIIYLAVNKKGVSGIMWGILPIILLLFFVLKFFKLEKLLDLMSKGLSNFITSQPEVPTTGDNERKCDTKITDSFFSLNTNPATKKTILKFNKDKKLSYDNKKQDKYNSPDCWMRYTIIFDIVKIILFSMIGYGFFTMVYAAQVKKACPL